MTMAERNVTRRKPVVTRLSDAAPLRDGVKRSCRRTALYKTLLALPVC